MSSILFFGKITTTVFRLVHLSSGVEQKTYSLEQVDKGADYWSQIHGLSLISINL